MTHFAAASSSRGSGRAACRSTNGTGREPGREVAPVLDLDQLLRNAVERGASDVHIKVGSPPFIRVDGRLERTRSRGRCRRSRPSGSRSRSCRSNAPRSSSVASEADFAYSVSGLGRFRVNVMRQRGSVGLVLRRVQSDIPSFEDLGLPPVIRKLTDHQRGLILVTGPTGSGKTTTLGVDDRLHQRQLQPAHRHDRRPDRNPARRQVLDRQPARGRHRHGRLPRRVEARAAPGPRRHPRRRGP